MKHSKKVIQPGKKKRFLTVKDSYHVVRQSVRNHPIIVKLDNDDGMCTCESERNKR